MNEQPTIPLTTTDPSQVTDEMMDRFMNFRYPDANGGLQPASTRSWDQDMYTWQTEASLPLQAIMDTVDVDVPGNELRSVVHTVSGQTWFGFLKNQLLLLHNSFVFGDSTFGRVATVIPPAGTSIKSSFSLDAHDYVEGLTQANRNQPAHSSAQAQGKETNRDFGASDITLILDSSAYRADKPKSSASDHDHQDYQTIYEDPRYNPSGIQSEQQTLSAIYSRQVLKCRKSTLSEQSLVFQDFIAARPDVRTSCLGDKMQR